MPDKQEIERVTDKNEKDQSKLLLANKVIDLENKKIEKNKEIEKIALENADKSDERFFKIEQEKNRFDKECFDKNDKHRTRVFYSTLFLVICIILFIFYPILKENKFLSTIQIPKK